MAKWGGLGRGGKEKGAGVVSFGSVTEREGGWGWLDGESGDGRREKGGRRVGLEMLHRGEGGGGG